MPTYSLPELPYDYSALEPYISGHILELHHGKHHAAYVEKANSLSEQLVEAPAHMDLTRLAALERSLTFNVSGHVLHSILWTNLAPDGGGEPQPGPLAKALEKDLGGFESFRRKITEAAATIMGSGWAALVWEPTRKRLLITQIHDHHSNLPQDGIPLLVIDAWEHAYYLQYENRKTDFFDAVWKLWNWDDIEERYAVATGIKIMAA